MKTAPIAGGAAGAPLNAWNRFWFQPTDPAALGLMRVVTGLLVLYVHLAYCFDLTAFFGPHGWWDRKAVDLERKDRPMQLYEWGREQKPSIPTPQVEDRRVAVFDFLEHLPEEKAKRDEALRFLYFILDQNQGQGLSDAMYRQSLNMLLNAAKLVPDNLIVMRQELGKSKFEIDKHLVTLPAFFGGLPTPEERVRVWDDALRLLQYMPRATLNFEYVLGWLGEMNEAQRLTLAHFLRDLADGPASRERLKYMEIWQLDPIHNYARGHGNFSLWFHISNPATLWTCHLIILGVFVLFTIGLFTRVTSILAWVGALFYIHRSQPVLFGMDSIMNVLLFYLMWGPCGAAFSVDRLIARYRAARALFKAGGQPVPWAEAVLAGPQLSATANFCMRLIQIHYCFIYAASGMAKLKGTSWWSSFAAWYTMANPEFCPLLQYPLYHKALLQLSSVQPLLAIVMIGIVYFTLALEISFPFLIWTRLRPFLVCAAVFLHTGIATMMGLTMFGALMFAMLLSFIPSAVIRERVVWAPGTGPKMTLRCVSRNKRHARAVALLRALDLTGQISLQELPAKNSADDTPVQMIGADGQTRTGADMICYALHTLVYGRTIGWLTGVPGVAIALRWWIGDHGQTVDDVEPAADKGSAKTPAAR